MKQHSGMIVTILIYLILGVGMLFFLTPKDKADERIVCFDSQGNAVIAEQGNFYIWLLSVSPEGTVTNIGRCPKKQGEVQVDVAVCEQEYYVQQSWYEGVKQHVCVHGKKGPERGFQQIFEVEPGENCNFTDLTVSDTHIYLSGVRRATGEVVAYEYGKEPGGGEKRYAFYLGASRPVKVSCRRQTCYVLTEANTVWETDLKGHGHLWMETPVSYMEAVSGGIFFRELGSGSLQYMDYEKELTYDCGTVEQIYAIDLWKNNCTAMLGLNGTPQLSFFSLTDTNRQFVEKWQKGWPIIWENLWQWMVVYSLLYAALASVTILMYRTVLKKRRIFVQVAAAIVCGNLLIIVALAGNARYREWEYSKLNSLDLTVSYGALQQERLAEKVSIDQILSKEYSNSEYQVWLSDTVRSLGLADNEELRYCSSELIYAREESAFIVTSAKEPYGRDLSEVYSKEVCRAVESCRVTADQQSLLAMHEGITYAITVVPLRSSGQQLFLMTSLPRTEDFLASLAEAAGQSMFVYGMIFLVLALLLLFMHKKWEPLERIVRQMERISYGDFSVPARELPENELGQLWISMEQMSRNLQMQSYTRKSILEYIRQFAPKNFERFFGRESIHELSAGETVELEATVAAVTLAGSDGFLRGDAKSLRQINGLLDIISRKNVDQGVVLQNGSRFESVKVVFEGGPESADKGLNFGISCIEELLAYFGKPSGRNPFVLLHTSKFTAGLAGGGEHMYPFVSSSEFELLSSYMEKFEKRGVFMVITRPALKKLKLPVQVRQIGFLGADRQKESFQVYEVLDACPVRQKESKLLSQDKFREALKLFYQNEFYLARSRFSEILRDCPEDGIAKWYVFACEEKFNQKSGTIHHGLFYQA